MNNMYTVESFNRFLESETKSGNKPVPCFTRTAAIDFVNMPADAFFAAMKICRYGDKIEGVFKTPSSFTDLARGVSNGLVSIWNLSGRQKMLFVTYFADRNRTAELVQEAAEAEKWLQKFQTVLPVAVTIMDASEEYDEKLVKKAQVIASQYVDWNRRVINYRDYIKYINFEQEYIKS